jgi:pimeloyl-ACP methyl ester carboxylesterase
MFRLVDEPARRAGLRIVAPERPGFGRSTFQPGRRLTDWPSDVIALAKALDLSSFGVAGISGGGPYAVACAALLPERVTVAALISPMGPLKPPEGLDDTGSAQRIMFRLAPYLRPAMRGALLVGRAMFLGAPQTTYKLLMRRAGPADRKVLSDPQVRENLLAGVSEGLRPGVAGSLAEAMLFAQPWNVPFHAVKAPVLLWQGTADQNVPVTASLRLGELIASAKIHRIEGAGHYWIFEHIEEVLTAIKQKIRGAGVRQDILKN